MFGSLLKEVETRLASFVEVNNTVQTTTKNELGKVKPAPKEGVVGAGGFSSKNGSNMNIKATQL
jgi:hypothetical protein